MSFDFQHLFEQLSIYIQSHHIDIQSVDHKDILDFAFQLIAQAPKDQKHRVANHLGVSFHRFNRIDLAIQCFHQAVQIDPHFLLALSHLGLSYLDQNDYQEGLTYLEKAYHLAMNDENHANNLLSAYISAGKIEKGLHFAQRLLEDSSIKHSGLIQHNYGQILSKIGLGAQAQVQLDHAYQLGQKSIKTENNRLYQLLFHELDPKVIAREHLHWGTTFATAKTQLMRSQAKPIYNLAFISPDFRIHSVAYFFKSLRFDLYFQQFKVTCYYNYHLSDRFTEEIKQQVDEFYQVNQWHDKQLIEHIQAQNIDILIDLAGHTSGNRLALFAQRVAPIQITWLGYPATTGLMNMDYRIVDQYTDSRETEALHSEKLLYLRAPFICYTPPSINIKPVSKTLGDQSFYFASFNNPSKISDLTVALWAEILKQVPFAKLLLKGTGLEQDEIQNIQKQRFKEYGVHEDQLIFLARTNGLYAHYECYQQVDLALDTYPYCGTTTTCEALWMGVPVLTLVGNSHVSRVGYSLLSGVKLDDFIAFSADDYVQKAVFWAQPENRSLIYLLKSILRDQLLQSPLCDQLGFSLSFEENLLKLIKSY